MALRVAVTGLAVTFPFGGVFWDYFQYFSGFSELGHEVMYIEDTGQWCYDPAAGTYVEAGDGNAAYFARQVAAADPALRGRWFFRDARGRSFGCSWDAVSEFCRGADLFLNISGCALMRDEYLRAQRVAFLDSDPMYTQASVPEYLDGAIAADARARIETMRQHHVFFTFAGNVGAADCAIPTQMFPWIPTRQPVVLRHFRNRDVPVPERRRVMTTVASWEPSDRELVVGGTPYRGKSVEFERFVDLPLRSPIPLELAMSGRAPAGRLQRAGWRMVDGYAVSRDPWVYLDYLAHSFGEWSVAKNAYVASRSGWFSGRTACYLALGVPAVVQDTGFARSIPTGEGVLTFSTVEEAAERIRSVAAAPERHARAARAVVEECFESDKVLRELLDRAFG